MENGYDQPNMGPVLKEVTPGWTPKEVQQLTEPALIVDHDCQEITLM
jgi:acyl CoA:acetate/3-ketoacid CoA transferase beta subunit